VENLVIEMKTEPTLLSDPLKIGYYFVKFLYKKTKNVIVTYNIQLLLIAVLGVILYTRFVYAMYWITLGILSSIGLGSGLHTFVLFLAPFIIEKTMLEGDLSIKSRILDTFGMVYYETFLWGFGTAIGELPPYFVARMGNEYDIKSVLKKKEKTWMDKGQLIIYNLIQKMGFWGILICASVPNPLFDLAGIMCGTFGVDFYTFFGAVFLGKAVIKCSIQVFSG
jgi:membrane protein YqaA with SNARE-associated domain